MNQPLLLALLAAGFIGMCAAVLAITRERRQQASEPKESVLAVSTEGQKVCPKCRMGNLLSASTCSSCGERLA